MVLCRNKEDTSPGGSLNLLKLQFDHIDNSIRMNFVILIFAFWVIFHAFLASADFFKYQP